MAGAIAAVRARNAAVVALTVFPRKAKRTTKASVAIKKAFTYFPYFLLEKRRLYFSCLFSYFIPCFGRRVSAFCHIDRNGEGFAYAPPQ